MNKKPMPVVLNEQEKEALSQQILMVINDEIANANAVFESYSYDPYVKAASEEVKRNSMATKLQELAIQNGFCIITGTLIFNRTAVAGLVLQSTYMATQVSITDINPATMTNCMVRLDVPMDQLKANNIFVAPEKGVYGYIQLGDVFRLVDVPEEIEEEQPVDEEDITKPEVTE